MHYVFRFLTLLCLFCFPFLVISAQTEADDFLKFETSVVVVPVSVVDSNNRFIPNLQKKDFQVFENKKLQEIASFETADAPFTVAILLDVSTSTKFKLKEIQDAALAFLEQLRLNDTALVFTFDNELIKVYDGKTESLNGLQQSIRLSQTGRATSLYDAVNKTVNEHLANRTGKKAVVLFTDGVDTSSTETYAKSLRSAQESSALIYSIQYDTLSDSKEVAAKLPTQSGLNIGARSIAPVNTEYQRGTTYLKLLSGNSGGRYYFADTKKTLADAFELIANELSRQYVISYYPQDENEAKKRSVSVKVNVAGAKSRTRKTYDFSKKIK